MIKLGKLTRFLLLTTLFLSVESASLEGQVLGSDDPIQFSVARHDPSMGLGSLPRTPINPPSASLDDHTFYINGEHSGYTLYLIDNSGDEPDVVYQVVIPAGVNAVVLPATLSGTYELQLHNGGAFYFYAEIILS